MIFESWYGLFRVAAVSVMAYFALVVILRGFGKRTLAKMNIFDFVVTVALGSCLATIILSKTVVVLEGIVAFTMLAGLQFIISWSSVRFSWVQGLVKAEPTLLVYQGRMLRSNMRKVRITESEILAALRNSGMGSDQPGAVVLETDGTISVIEETDGQGKGTLSDVDLSPAREE